MNPPPFPTGLPHDKDAEHLKMLGIFHFVLGGFGFFGLGFLGIHFFIMRMAFSPENLKNSSSRNGPPPEEFIEVMQWFYLFVAVMILVAITVNVLSGVFLLKRRHRMFSIIVAALDCLQFPIGTALGVFTIIVLLRDSVRLKYAAAQNPFP